MKYKVGDKVVLGDLKNSGAPTMYSHKTGTITNVDSDGYRIVLESGDSCYILEKRIDYEATAKLNEPKMKYHVGQNVVTKKIDNITGTNKAAIQSVRYDTKEYVVFFLNDTHNHIKLIDEEDILCSYEEYILNNTQTKEDIKKGSDKMDVTDILDTWKRRKCNKIELERQEKTEQITRSDEIKKIVEKHVAQINKTIKEKYNTALEARSICTVLTPETEEKLKVVNHESETQKLNIESKVKDIKAILEVAENQDKVFEILNKQGIIDKNYNIL